MSTLLDLTLKISYTNSEPLTDPTFDRRLLGKIHFLTNIRQDLSYTVLHLSQYMQNHCSGHLQATYHALRYLSKDPDLGIFLSATPSRFKPFATPIRGHVLIHDDL